MFETLSRITTVSVPNQQTAGSKIEKVGVDPRPSFADYYRKRGSASYIVREVLSVRERERERERRK